MAEINQAESLEGWNPRTSLGKKVKSGDIKNIDEILDKGLKILEPQIVDSLLPGLEYDLLEVGQAKGKFGGGKGSIWKQTQKKTCEKSRLKFSTFAVVGNRDGYVGVGFAGGKETVPAREKAVRLAKLNIIKIRRACGSWACDCRTGHSIPFKVSGKCGGIIVVLMPAPKGAGLKVEKKCARILRLAGIEDVYSKTIGNTSTKLNLFMACFDALLNLSAVKVMPEFEKSCGFVEGRLAAGGGLQEEKK